jgi:hypothetical protein
VVQIQVMAQVSSMVDQGSREVRLALACEKGMSTLYKLAILKPEPSSHYL